MQRLLCGESTDTNANDSQEIQYTESNVMSKCPITQQVISEPVKDSICGHTFEKSAILAHVKKCNQKGKSAK